MIERYQGNSGARTLTEALKLCSLVEHHDGLAADLAEVGQLIPYEPQEKLITQGAFDHGVYFLLNGSVDVFINGRKVSSRKQPESVGEMSLISPTEPRSATVIATSNVIAFKVSDDDLFRLAEQHTGIWKAIAQLVADRLRQRSVFLKQPNPRPHLFLGCSVEGLEIAKQIQFGLKHNEASVRLWTQGVFGPGSVTLDALLMEIQKSDFAAFVFSPDDEVTSRKNEYRTPRDNTVFELGLFMGKLDRKRTFIIKEHSSDVKIPSDLLGITPITYSLGPDEDLCEAIGPVCTELEGVINELGTR